MPDPQRQLLLSPGLLLSLAAVLTATSWAAWTVTTSNSVNTLATNTVVLQDNQGAQGGTATSSGGDGHGHVFRTEQHGLPGRGAGRNGG